MYDFNKEELTALHECGSADLSETLVALFCKAVRCENQQTVDMLQLLTGKLMVLGWMGCYASFYRDAESVLAFVASSDASMQALNNIYGSRIRECCTGETAACRQK